MKGLRAPTQEQGGALSAIVGVLFGGWVRLFIPQAAGFPVNDGGLFYVMLRDLQANGLRLPVYVHYNGLNIPFAYPPLGFYVGAILSDILRIDAIQILQWLPAVVLIAALPAFYGLAKAVLGTSFRAGLATLVYAFTPRAITWQIMGGGLTRSFGQLFLILALTYIYQTFTGYSRKRVALSILFSGLVVLSHPEAALQTAGIALLFWLFRGRSKQGTLSALAIGAGTLVLSAVWWLPAIVRYGAAALLSAGQTGQHNLLALLQPFLLNFVDEPLLSLAAVFALVGVGAELAKRRWLLLAWLFLPFLIEPRSAPTYAMIPLALLAGIGLADVILTGIARLGAGTENPLESRAGVIFLLFVGVYMFGQTMIFGSQAAGTALRPAAREAFAWIKANTPGDAKFVVLTGNTAGELFCDAPVEWFPALTDRVSLTTIQGREWTQGADFGSFATQAQAVSACMLDSSVDCVEAQTAKLENQPVSYNYLYIQKKAPDLVNCRAVGTSLRGEQLIDELRASPQYTEVYQNDSVAVFERR